MVHVTWGDTQDNIFTSHTLANLVILHKLMFSRGEDAISVGLKHKKLQRKSALINKKCILDVFL